MPKRRANLHARASVWERDRLAEQTLRDYKPFLTVRDVPSRGRSHRIQSNTVQRMHHLFSDLERAAFYTLDNSGVIDIREQYPLLPLSATIAIAEAPGYRHPSFAGQLVVMTTDLLVTWPDGVHDAYAIKHSDDLSRPRTKQKLEIEAEYWRRRSITWRVLTEHELSTPKIAALCWLHRYRDPRSVPLTGRQLENVIGAVASRILGNPHTALASHCSDCDDQLGLAPGTALAAARHAIAIGAWPVELDMGIDPLQPLRWRRQS